MTERSILFVDDEEKIISVLKHMFENKYTVFTANNGPDALTLIHKHAIDIIVSDQRMPEMQGVDLLKQVKESSPKTICILLSSYADIDVFMNSVNTGDIFRFVEKPWNTNRFQKTITAAKIQITQDPDIVKYQNLGLLVLSEDQEVYTTIHQLFGYKLNVYYVKDLQEAIAFLEERHELAVFITDTMAEEEDTLLFFDILKTTYPSLVSVALTTKADAHTIVRFINEGKIFRYLPKPVETELLEFDINAALKHYAEVKQEPLLLESEYDLAIQAEEILVEPQKKNTTFLNKLKALLPGN
ncbi:MAG: response regulator [Thiomargarita sp.]|nr:response regulator [Thiomargarita sp.]